MGIKGIYKEIGTGNRISLTRVAVEKLEETGRPLRLAIDISIWQFQVQAARGGSNPAIRTLFYRLLRLLSLSVQPIFVFDGPNKPVFKRNKRSGRGDGVATAMAKRLIRLFGFHVHDSPGEAEAECALLQQHGIVDAVLSEDVDTIMFGCTRTLRNWSSEGTKGSKTPTHVSMYDTEELRKGAARLDREGMVLVALMSGGDYIPEGIPGAGVKLACEAARAGFGKTLCQLKRSDTTGLASWRDWLIRELRNNESGFFRTKHKALNVPDNFPNMDVLRYYTHPVVSPAPILDRLKQQNWDKPIDVQGLREFVQETFDWTYRIGAIKFIRVLAPGLLIRKMMQRNNQRTHLSEDLEAMEKEESALVKSIKNRRAHFSTDATSELRISFIPTDIVGYNFQNEPDEVMDYGRDGLALNSDDEMEALVEEEGAESVAKPGSRKPFSPTEPDLLWIPETIAKLSIPLMVEDWEEGLRAKAVARPKAGAPKQTAKAKATGGMATGALDRFVKVTKNSTQTTGIGKPTSIPLDEPTSPPRARNPLGVLPTPSQGLPPLFSSSQAPLKTRSTVSSKHSKPKSKRNVPKEPKAHSNSNPWTIAGSQVSPRVSKITKSTFTKTSEAIIISSSPPASPTTDLPSVVNHTETKAAEDGSSVSFSSQPSSPQKRRSITPPRPARYSDEQAPGGSAVGELSPTPNSTDRPRRKLARTESMPTAPTPQKSSTEPRKARGLPRAQTVAVEAMPSDPDDDDEFDLPPLSSIFGKIPSAEPTSKSTTFAGEPPVSTRTAEKKKQVTLGTTFGTRMTKMYVPRKSAEGFFREVDVSVVEAEAMMEEQTHTQATGSKSSSSRGSGRGAIWRRSDISCIDLTGED